MKKIFICVLMMLTACAHTSNTESKPEDKKTVETADEKDLWLEDVTGIKALEWSKAQSEISQTLIKKNPRYQQVYDENHFILTAEDRIPNITLHGNDVYNFWQDSKHVRGIWRKANLEEFLKKDPHWETLLDVDELAKIEKQNWKLSSTQCLEPDYKRCLIELSIGGKDAQVVREFDVTEKTFVKEGFYVPEAKNRVAWFDDNRLLIASNFGPDSLTTSGYPRQVKILNRGQKFSEAQLLFTTDTKNFMAYPMHLQAGGKVRNYIVDGIDFYRSDVYKVDDQLKLTKLPLPQDSEFLGVLQSQLIFSLRSPLQKYPMGSVLSMPADAVDLKELHPVFVPTKNKFFEGLQFGRDAMMLTTMEDVNARLFTTAWKNGKWAKKEIALPKYAAVSLSSGNSDVKNEFFYMVSSFVNPNILYLMKEDQKVVLAKSLPNRFDTAGVQVEQHFAVSKDKTKVPYYLIKPKNFKANGKTPTVLYGYGGFEIPLNPSYYATVGKSLIERGFAFAVANLRGGSEYGPKWHTEGMLEHKQNVFDDFIAVAEDLVNAKVTSPAHLGIWGGSNGGLLVGAAMTQRPELFGAVVCERPLLDMMRYQHLLAGASWVSEYGDPEDPKFHDIILKYSPYQNLDATKKYPSVLFYTSTMDDRVHPGHARRMAHKMMDEGADVLFYENPEGGHGGYANQEQATLKNALTLTFFMDHLAN